ncbi:hypothetical protein PTSG_01271 [Salpingoeca rosetta]|uniref:Repressor of RNA polymerase III transcription n=1 Tax=Salpingoeca rosetta (strain ATCC 50818 / BSB-021) TaxID=946362 RepID=F2TZV3_SALR5|nr:uncharacterized protein PTSG_01271 [Salpingoeca rosetta]EGD80681.1 hypothetical protein PTSG_01271 [Salpingoeca rosetta]|eukprot:XP_004997242.1 hypothetical protein PTSG_01271 [Salpingoeca rosetta]
MKLLEIPELATLSSEWTGLRSDCRLICSIQAFSCKKAGEDKKLYKQLAGEGDMEELVMLAPPGVVSAAVGMVAAPASSTRSQDEEEQAYCSKKTLYFLKSTLNAAYSPDYDFSHAKGAEFALVPSADVARQHISAVLSPVLGRAYTSRSGELWSTLDSLISLADCDVFLYCGDSQDDPFTEEGTTWSFAYLFFNKKLKRMILFTAISLSISAPLHELENKDDLPEDLMFQGSTNAEDDDDTMATEW